MPPLKVCEKLKKKDAQVCDLRFGMLYAFEFPPPKFFSSIILIFFISVLEKQIDLSAVDLKKLKVRDLKKILNDWDENCDGCIEKTDYIRRIEELKPKYYKETTKQEL